MAKRKGPTPRREGPRAWTRFQYVKKCDPLRGLGGERMYENSRYVVIAAVLTDHQSPMWPGTTVVHLSVRRQDRAAGPFPWRDMHRIKCELVGSESEAVELYPAASRNLDAANQRHLFCTAPGNRFDYGFDAGRQVEDDESMRAALAQPENMAYLKRTGVTIDHVMRKSVQSPFEDGTDYDLGHEGLIWDRVRV
jgi:hypothetical protein